MGQKGMPTPEAIIDRIVILRDQQNLKWAVIGRRFGIKGDTAHKLYKNRKEKEARNNP